MDPRLKALTEVRGLLEAQGWATGEDRTTSEAPRPGRKTPVGPNPMLTFISLAAIATNFILIGANHDLRASKMATVSVLAVRAGLDIGKPFEDASTNLREEVWFVMINGEWVWGARPNPAPLSEDRPENRRVERLPVPIPGRKILQLGRNSGSTRLLVGQTHFELDSVKRHSILPVQFLYSEVMSSDKGTTVEDFPIEILLKIE